MAVAEVIKYDGSKDVFAWKFPNSELGTWSQVIVNETQEAILFKGGQALDWFGAGRHVLETKNIPVLNNILNIPFGGKSPFSAEVWYVNKANVLDIKWGTPTPVQVQDSKYNVFVPVRAFGQFGIKIVNAKLFLTTLVGTLTSFTTEDITNYFKGAYLAQVKDDIASYVIKNKISVLEVNAYINEISSTLKERINPVFAEYGIELVNFYVNNIDVPENDPAIIKLKEALSKKAEMDIIGYSYSQGRTFDVLEGVAKNEGSGSGNMMGAGIGLGVGVGMGNNFNGVFNELGRNLNTNQTKECPHCKTQINADNKFCHVCGKHTTIGVNRITCSDCGEVIDADVKFCSNCGKEVGGGNNA